MNRKALKEKLRGHSCDDCFLLNVINTRWYKRSDFCRKQAVRLKENICSEWEEAPYLLSTEQLVAEDRAEYAKSIDEAMLRKMFKEWDKKNV